LTLTEAQDWPQWRGVNRDGIAVGVRLPQSWPQELRQAWKVEVGEGYSGPVTADNKIVIQARQDDQEVILCLKKEDGETLWRDAYKAEFTPSSYAEEHGKGPFATPTIHGDKVFTVGIRSVVSCLDLEKGAQIWRRPFKRKFKKPYPLWGASNSPLIEGDLCIVGIGREDDGALAALNRRTGHTVWQLDGFDPAYSSAVAVDLAGERQIVVLARTKLVGLAPATGAVRWDVPYTVPYDQNAITPTVVKDLVVCSGWKKKTECTRISRAGDGVVARNVWSNSKITFFMSSPVILKGHVFGLAQRDKGSLVCLDLQDGKVKWSSPGRVGEYVSIVGVEDQLLILTTDGDLVVVAADPAAYREVYRIQVADTAVWAHLTVTRDRIYVKDQKHLTAYALPKT
jgi:outer membrane protein assembly factor BamB